MKSKLALVSLLLGIFSFVHLLGIEKAVLAVIFGLWALKETTEEPKLIRMSWLGIILGLIYLLVITLIVVFKFPKFISILEKLR